jgi:hypothetical protein
MDQYLVAAIALVVFFAFVAGYFIGSTERRSRRAWIDGEILAFDGPLTEWEVERLKAAWNERHDGSSSRLLLP